MPVNQKIGSSVRDQVRVGVVV